MLGKEMPDPGRDEPERSSLDVWKELMIRSVCIRHDPRRDFLERLFQACKDIDREINEGELIWISDDGYISFSNPIPEKIQELKKEGDEFPSHPMPGCYWGLFSPFGKLLQRFIPGYQQPKKVKEQSWRLDPRNILPEVRSQGHYRTCVFFAVIGAVEGRYRLHMIRNNPDHETVPQLSVQDCIDGIQEVPIDPARCLDWIIEHGIVPEHDWPYIGEPQGGHVLGGGRTSVVNGYRIIIQPGEEHAERIVEEIMEGGPIVGILSFPPDFWHAVILIGGVYKDDRVDNYVIQNSWGAGWEEDGRGLVPISCLVEAYVPVLG